MYTDIWHQLFLFFVFFVIGAVFALIYDTLKVSVKFAPQNAAFTVIRDVAFWLIVTAVMFGVSLKFNDGEIRFYMFLGIFLGAFLYFNTVSRFVVAVLDFVTELLKKITLFIIKIICFPIKLLNKPVFFAFSFTKNNAVKMLRKVKFKLKVFIKFKR